MKRFAHEMPHKPLFILFHLFHGDFQYRRSEHAGIEGLPAACRVEGSAIERYLPDGVAMTACEFVGAGYHSGKRPEK
jgi:hypothetical protein